MKKVIKKTIVEHQIFCDWCKLPTTTGCLHCNKHVCGECSEDKYTRICPDCYIRIQETRSLAYTNAAALVTFSKKYNEIVNELKKKFEEQLSPERETYKRMLIERTKFLFDRFPRLASFGWVHYIDEDSDHSISTCGLPNINGREVYQSRYKWEIGARKAIQEFMFQLDTEVMIDAIGTNISIKITRAGEMKIDKY